MKQVLNFEILLVMLKQNDWLNKKLLNYFLSWFMHWVQKVGAGKNWWKISKHSHSGAILTTFQIDVEFLSCENNTITFSKPAQEAS